MSTVNEWGHRAVTMVAVILLLWALYVYTPEVFLAVVLFAAMTVVWWLLLRLFRFTEVDDDGNE